MIFTEILSVLTVYYLDSSFSRKDPTLRVALRRKRLGFRLRGRFGFIEEKVKPVRNNYNDYQACPSSAPLKMTGEVSSAVFVKDASALFVNGQSG